MLENLTDRLQSVTKTIRGQARFTEQNISDAMREVRIALIEADVALAVVKDFIDRVKTKALGVEVLQSLSPGQAIIKIVQDELTILMGDQNVSLDLNVAPPAIILMAGLQGSGKTTTSAKLAKLLIEKKMRERFKNSFGMSFDNFMDDANKTSEAVKEEDEIEGETPVDDQTEADFLFFGAGADMDNKFLMSLIEANKEIDGL